MAKFLFLFTLGGLTKRPGIIFLSINLNTKSSFKYFCTFVILNLRPELPLNFSKKNITEELLNRLRNGDMLAFDQVYKLYSHKLYSFIFKILKNEAEADDIVQEVFVKIWESRDKLRDLKLFNSFIFTIAYNNSIDLIRKRINNSKYLEHLRNSSIIYTTPTLVSDIEFTELNTQVEKLIANLPERQKEVFLLHKHKGLTYAEIADQLGISKNTVENHMVKALKYLRQNIDSTLLLNMLFVCLFL